MLINDFDHVREKLLKEYEVRVVMTKVCLRTLNNQTYLRSTRGKSCFLSELLGYNRKGGVGFDDEMGLLAVKEIQSTDRSK